MANTCDQCGSSFPNTVALFQHLGSCKEFKKAQEALEASRARTAEVYRIRDLAAQKERPDTSKNPANKVVAKKAATSASSEGFQCHLCDQVLGRRDALKVHLMDVHRLSHADANSELAKRPGDPRATCQYCGTEMNKKQLVIHYRICKKAPKTKVAAARGTASQDLNVSRDSLVERTGNLEIKGVPLMSEEKFLEDLRAYMDAEDGGNLAQKSTKNYMMRIHDYGKYWKKENPNFSFAKLCIFGNKACLDPPSPANWETTLGSAQARGQGLSAFNKMIDFLRTRALLAKDRGQISKEDYGTHESVLSGIRAAASRILKRVEKYKEQEKTEGDAQRERLAEGDRDREVPGPVLEKILKAYLGCDYRKEMFNLFAGDLEDALRRNKVTPTQVRDFVIVECILTAPGGRNDSWYKMKVKELLNPRFLDDGKKVCIEVGRHKTSKNYGAARDIMPVRTYNAIMKYYQTARSLIYPKSKKDDGEEHVFVQGGNGNWFDRPYDVLEAMLKKGSDFDYRITPYAIRRHLSTEAQGHSSAQIRENMPRHMNHSEKTAKGTYRKKMAQIEEHSKFLDELVTWSTPDDQLPDVQLNEGDVEADRVRVNRAEKEKAVQKKTAQDERVQANKSARSTRSARKPGERYFFSPDDRKIVQRAFLFAVDSDGNRKPTITSYIGTMRGQKSDFHKAYDGDKVFKGMVDRIMEEEDFEMSEMKTKIMNCYRALHRENPGNTSASTSGAGKAKALKPKSSKKDATKSPAKKKQRWDEESDSEEEDSPEFSEESSE